MTEPKIIRLQGPDQQAQSLLDPQIRHKLSTAADALNLSQFFVEKRFTATRDGFPFYIPGQKSLDTLRLFRALRSLVEVRSSPKMIGYLRSESESIPVNIYQKEGDPTLFVMQEGSFYAVDAAGKPVNIPGVRMYIRKGVPDESGKYPYEQVWTDAIQDIPQGAVFVVSQHPGREKQFFDERNDILLVPQSMSTD